MLRLNYDHVCAIDNSVMRSFAVSIRSVRTSLISVASNKR